MIFFHFLVGLGNGYLTAIFQYIVAGNCIGKGNMQHHRNATIW